MEKGYYKKFLRLKKDFNKYFPEITFVLIFCGYKEDKHLFLHKILIKEPKYRGSKRGTNFMKYLCNYCDDYNITIKTFPSSGNLSHIDNTRLIKWYEGFGFEWDIIDYQQPLREMVRKPIKQ